jgi:hypothetical protein
LVRQRAGRDQHDIECAQFLLALVEHAGMEIQPIDIEFMAGGQLRSARR